MSHPGKIALGTGDAARYLGVSIGTIRRWADMGYIAFYRTPGGQRRFSVASLDEAVRLMERRRAV